jgi:hypothetical protein
MELLQTAYYHHRMEHVEVNFRNKMSYFSSYSGKANFMTWNFSLKSITASSNFYIITSTSGLLNRLCRVAFIYVPWLYDSLIQSSITFISLLLSSIHITFVNDPHTLVLLHILQFATSH